MKGFAAFMATVSLISSSLAAPTISVRDGAELQQVQVVYQECDSAISVEVRSGGTVVAEACSNTLDTGSFAELPIRFDVNKKGAGNVTVGSTTYKVHQDKEISGGIVCGRLYDDAESVVSCDVSVPAGMSFQSLSKRHECIPGGATSMARALHIRDPEAALNSRYIAPVPFPVSDDNTHDFHVSKRQGCYPQKWTELVGDGNPHQNYYHQQVTENNECREAVCNTGTENAKSVSVGFSVETGASITEWISGGFSVSISWSAAVSQGCEKEGENITICQWHKMAHTAYTVRAGSTNTCSYIKSLSDPFVLFSPNTNNAGGNYYCVVGAHLCRSMGSAYWDYNGRAGGP
ncbi:hypothetical protein CGLO_02476 [Colletotrichum gloeosporioides Cg-14]|uniref:FHA domain-containing protein n=1 Tax=Colletotrichum gloeosporioides (strain Cg-14) TaxID=1237896 RepID=T0M0U5_COLGC|nr:hypothetical protein CGLO_02476 [Colletotrichum gloeosporioides Cg-14]